MNEILVLILMVLFFEPVISLYVKFFIGLPIKVKYQNKYMIPFIGWYFFIKEYKNAKLFNKVQEASLINRSGITSVQDIYQFSDDYRCYIKVIQGEENIITIELLLEVQTDEFRKFIKDLEEYLPITILLQVKE